MRADVRLSSFRMHADMRRGRTRAELEALSRKEIQQLAMDASLKANQKTSALIEQILAGQGGQATSPAQCKSAAPRTPLGDVSNGGSSDANIAAPDGHGAAEEDELAQQFAACSFSEKRRRRQSSRLSLSRSLREAELSPGPAASPPALDGSASRETVSSASTLGWEEEGELETIRETLAQLLELGFSNEEAQWAIDQAKKKRDSELSHNEAAHASLSDAHSGAEDGGAEAADALSMQMNLLAVNDEGPTAPGGKAY